MFTITYYPSKQGIRTILQAVEQFGFTYEPGNASHFSQSLQELEKKRIKRLFIISVSLTIPLFLIMVAMIFEDGSISINFHHLIKHSNLFIEFYFYKKYLWIY